MEYLGHLQTIIYNLTGEFVEPPEEKINVLDWYVDQVQALIGKETDKPPITVPKPPQETVSYDDTELKDAIEDLKENHTKLKNQIEKIDEDLADYVKTINQAIQNIESTIPKEENSNNVVTGAVQKKETEIDLTNQITGTSVTFLLNEKPGEEYALYFNGVRQRRVMYEIDLEDLIITTKFETVPKQGKDTLVFVYQKILEAQGD